MDVTVRDEQAKRLGRREQRRMFDMIQVHKHSRLCKEVLFIFSRWRFSWKACYERYKAIPFWLCSLSGKGRLIARPPSCDVATTFLPAWLLLDKRVPLKMLVWHRFCWTTCSSNEPVSPLVCTFATAKGTFSVHFHENVTLAHESHPSWRTARWLKADISQKLLNWHEDDRWIVR